MIQVRVYHVSPGASHLTGGSAQERQPSPSNFGKAAKSGRRRAGSGHSFVLLKNPDVPDAPYAQRPSSAKKNHKCDICAAAFVTPSKVFGCFPADILIHYSWRDTWLSTRKNDQRNAAYVLESSVREQHYSTTCEVSTPTSPCRCSLCPRSATRYRPPRLRPMMMKSDMIIPDISSFVLPIIKDISSSLYII
jgi:hypothetical protein